jgi:hypothetical protein
MEVVGRSGVLHVGNPEGGEACPPSGAPTASVMDSTPDPSMGECQKADLNTAVGEDARSLDLKAARILPEAVKATWEMHRLWEILLMASRVTNYSENPVTQKKIEPCLIIEILT